MSKIISNENSIVRTDMHKKYNSLFIDFVSTNIEKIVIISGWAQYISVLSFLKIILCLTFILQFFVDINRKVTVGIVNIQNDEAVLGV